MSDDYATTSPGGRQQIMSGAITFWNSVTAPIQMRQSVQALDMSATIEKYEQNNQKSRNRYINVCHIKYREIYQLKIKEIYYIPESDPVNAVAESS